MWRSWWLLSLKDTESIWKQHTKVYTTYCIYLYTAYFHCGFLWWSCWPLLLKGALTTYLHCVFSIWDHHKTPIQSIITHPEMNWFVFCFYHVAAQNMIWCDVILKLTYDTKEIHQRFWMVLLMEEIRHHLGCVLKKTVNTGIDSTTNLNWWSPDFSHQQ